MLESLHQLFKHFNNNCNRH